MQILDGVRARFIKTDKFKTNAIGVFFSTKLAEDTATVNALIPAVLRRGCSKYTTMKAISGKLESLYGARFDCGVSKKGEYQVLRFVGEAVSNKYIEDEEEDIFKGLIGLIKQIIFEPLVLGGTSFREDYIEQEKVKLQNIIESRKNDKVQYALERCYELMCDGEPYGICEYGKIEDLAKITNSDLMQAYKRMLKEFQIDIVVAGDIDEKTFENITNMFGISRRDVIITFNLDNIQDIQIKNLEETFDINQGKLSLGYRTGVMPNTKEYYSMLVYNGILGGGVHSKLFQNVREKNSLAYYAFSRYDKFKGVLGISCGIEQENYQKALDTILEQVENMKRGDITKEEYDTTITTLETSMNSLNDEEMSLLEFNYGEELIGSERDIQDVICEIRNVTIEDVVRVAQNITLDTIYFMKGRN